MRVRDIRSRRAANSYLRCRRTRARPRSGF